MNQTQYKSNRRKIKGFLTQYIATMKQKVQSRTDGINVSDGIIVMQNQTQLTLHKTPHFPHIFFLPSS